MNLDDIISYYQRKYRIPDLTQCPATFNQLRNIMENYPDFQIAWVLTGNMNVAMIGPMEDKYKDELLRKSVLQCGMKKKCDSKGYEYYFWPPYEQNAQILIDDPRTIPKSLYTIIRALLLGYTQNFIILTEFYHHLMDQAYREKLKSDELEFRYQNYLSSYIQMMTPLITQAREWIKIKLDSTPYMINNSSV